MGGEHATPHQPGDVDHEAGGIGDHGEDHGEDHHGHDAESPGPVDVAAWSAFALGTGLGLAVAFSIAIATGGTPS